MPVRVLIVEDEREIAEELTDSLSGRGFEAESVHTGEAALDRHKDAELVLLDLGLPDGDGLEVCQEIRAVSNVPIIMVSARGDEFDRVLGLKLGADDYVVKPVGLRELVARMEAVVRRASPRPTWSLSRVFRHEPVSAGVGHIGPVRIDRQQRRVTLADQRIRLTRKEFDLLALLASEPGRVFAREVIMREVWCHDGAGETRTLGVHVASLRKKLAVPDLIETVRGVGFRINV